MAAPRVRRASESVSRWLTTSESPARESRVGSWMGASVTRKCSSSVVKRIEVSASAIAVRNKALAT